MSREVIYLDGLREKVQTILVSRFYIPCYVLYTCVQVFFFWIWLRLGLSICLFAFFGTSLLIVFLQIRHCPYSKMLDNVSIIFNFCLQTLFAGYLFLRNQKLFSNSAEFDGLIIFVFSVLCIVCFFLSVLRVLRELLCSKTEEAEEEVKEVKKKRKHKRIQR